MDEKERLFFTPLEDIIHNSMIPYAEYVIMDRAIPRVEDGLKPVQRRVLYTMYELGNTPDKPTKKSARIVGDCLGKFHPHGDTSVYGALVRLAQEFSVRNVLVDGQGNFGSIDGDGAAAMRYTEARLSPLAMELLRDIDKDTVDFTNNFDDTLTEPVILPGRFPNLLVNGAYGIAVGLATNIPTHNLGETIDGCIAMIKKPDIKLAEMMKYIKGPDFPSGGYIVATDLVNAYETGKGRIVLKAKCAIETEKGRETIVINELPYQVNKSLLQQKIIALRDDKNPIFQGIQEVTDESDVNGIRVLIKIKKDYHASEILEELYKKTDLTTSFNINMVAIADGKPKQLSLLEILKAYVEYQIKVIVRRSKYEYNEAKKRAHILEALVIAVKAIDEVVEIIKTSKNTSEARSRLMDRFDLDTEQAQAILDLRLARLTSLEVYKLEKELEETKALMAKLHAIINSKEKQKEVLISELSDIKKRFADDRRSEIIYDVNDIVIETEDNKKIENCKVYITASGELKKALKADFSKLVGNKSHPELSETAVISVDCKSDEEIKAFTNFGRVLKFFAEDLPLTKIKEKSASKESVTKELDENEKIVAMYVTDELSGSFVFFTKEGAVKRTDVTEYQTSRKNPFDAMKLKEGDEIINVEMFKEGLPILFVSKNGMILRATSDDIPLQGRISMGVKGMVLGDNDEVIFAGMSDKSGEAFAITDKAIAKRVIMAQIPETARARKGVKMFDFKKGGEIVGGGFVKEPYKLAVVADTKDVTVLSTENVEIDKREGKGKLLSDVKFFERIIAVGKLSQ